MSVANKSLTRNAQPKEGKDVDRQAGGLKFDRIFAILSLWMLVGLYADGTAHHNFPDLIDTFFTPWHAILYSGFLFMIGYLVFHLVRNVRLGYPWTRALPTGYNLSLLGVPLFFVSGIGDLIWHEIFGFEAGIEGLISPTHLLLAVAGALLVTGPLRSAWHRRNANSELGWSALFPALISLLALFSHLTFFTEYVNLIALPNIFVESPGLEEHLVFLTLVQGITGVILQVVFLMGTLLFGLKRWRFPFGAITLLVFGNTILMSIFHFSEISQYAQIVPAILAAALIIDFLYQKLSPSVENEKALRAFAFLTPFILYGGYIITLVITEGTWWAVHVWSGVILMAGIIGLLTSYLVVTPRLEEESKV